MTLNFGQQNQLLNNGLFNEMISRLLIKYALRTLRAEKESPGSQPPQKVELAIAIEKNIGQYMQRVISFVALGSDEIFHDLLTADEVVAGMQDDSLLERIYGLFEASWEMFAEKPQAQPSPSPSPQPATQPQTTVTVTTPTPVASALPKF
jgi:hypothetical protein